MASPRREGYGKTTTGDYHRPRRPNAETIRYLRSLPLDLTAGVQEIEAFLQQRDDHTEFPSALAAALSALDELRDELASLAGDEYASAAIEQVIRLTAPYSVRAARVCLVAVAGYAVFLATHRYGSHVLQTILWKCCAGTDDIEATSTESTDLALHPDAPALRQADDDALPSLTDSLLIIHAELLAHAATLARHVCGSHILRTLACLYGGWGPAAGPQFSQTARRGGKSKAKKIRNHSEPTPHATDVRLVRLSSSRLDSGKQLEEALLELTTVLTGNDSDGTKTQPGRLQEWACDSSAGPLLMILLRVWTYREAATVANEITLNTTKSHDTSSNHHLHRIPVEPKFPPGSHAQALAHRLLCWQSTDDKGGPQAADVIYGLAGESRGSHVLDTLLRLAPDEFYASVLKAGDFTTASTLREYIEHGVSNFVVQTILATQRNSEEALNLSKTLFEAADILVDARNRRRGILWRWAEMAVQFPACQPLVIQGLTAGLASQEKLSQCCAKVLLGMQELTSSEQEERLKLNVEGTRAMYHLLCFQPSHTKAVVESLLALTSTDLERLAKDGLGSRCVWDVVLDEEKSVGASSSIRSKLLNRLEGRWVPLAMDRVGHHVVRQMFIALSDMSSRERLVKELAAGSLRLEGNAMGRKIASVCLVREYKSRGKSEWERLVRKSLKEKAWLNDILHHEEPYSGGAKEGKRKYTNKTENTHDKSKRIKEMSMHDIVKAISLPQKK